MAFFEVEFPTELSFGAIGGPSFSTVVNSGFSGFEQRNRNWAFALSKWEVGFNNKLKADFDNAYAFFLAVGGKADAFRFKDEKDYIATTETLGTGTGSSKTFQLIKTYTIGGRTYTRTIKKPIQATVNDFAGNNLANTVKVYFNGTLKTLTSDYTVDATTGIITAAPAAGVVVTASCQFHFPARFDMDDMRAMINESDPNRRLMSWSTIQIVEVRL